MRTVEGRSAIITGGLTGQGLAIAQALADHGANVAAGSYVRAVADRPADAAAYPDAAEIVAVRDPSALSRTRNGSCSLAGRRIR